MLKERSFTFLAYGMFFPGLTAFCWTLYENRLVDFLIQLSGIHQPIRSAIFSLTALVFVYVAVETCALIAVKAGWASPSKFHKHAIHGHNKNRLSGFLRAAGEEIGWRCYLLPCLLDRFSVLPAFVISGVVWGLFHVPVMILLTHLLKPQKPIFTIFIQSLACLFAAFPHGWVAVKSGYSLWASTMMHWYWNVYNPTILGSIYTNSPGKYTGPQWLINGEGLCGCLVMFPVAVLVYLDLSYDII
ncbi:hypothetical protein ACF0H5_006280 [Mactra antiquata]